MKYTTDYTHPAAGPLRRIFQRTRRAFCAAGLLATLAIPAVAQIVDNGAFTTDSATNLDWADLDLAHGVSDAVIRTRLAPAGDLHTAGWQWATKAEVATFWQNAGIPDNTDFSTTRFAAVNALVSKIKGTRPVGVPVGAAEWYAGNVLQGITADGFDPAYGWAPALNLDSVQGRGYAHTGHYQPRSVAFWGYWLKRTHVAAPVAATLSHHYPFDANGNDVVGGAHLSLVNGATISTTPADVRIGSGAIDLTGAAKAVSNSNVVFGNKFSISLFSRLDTNGSFMTFLATAPGGTGSPGFKFFSRRFNQLSMAWEDTQNSESAADVLSVGEYHHLAAVVDKTAGNVTFYRDGILVGTFSVATNFADNLPFSVGDFGGTGGFTGHEGVIDDLKIYDGLLTAGEVAQLATGLPPVTTIIDDKFDDGNIATNTLGTGNGFSVGEQYAVTESGGFANFNAGGVSTEVIVSNPLDAVNPFQAAASELTFTYGDIIPPTAAVRQRLWLGYRRTGVVGIVFYPGTTTNYNFGTERQGLYVSVISQNINEDGYVNHGNLIATDDAGIRTTLASWNWSNPAQLSGLVVKLTTTSTNYQLEFSGAPGGVPNFVFGGASGLITGMGTVLPATKFDTGGMNQFFGGSGGQARLDSVLLRSGVPFTPPPTNTAPTNIALSATTIAENNLANAVIGTLSATDANSGDTHTFSLVSGAGDSDNGAFAISGNALTINASADFETKSSYSIRIRATDNGGLTFDKEFTVSITDVTIPQVIDFGTLAGKTFGDADFTVSATGGASGQEVTFSIAGGPATISGNLVSITGAGDVTVRASQAGFGDYSAASDVDQTFTVAQAAQLITFGPISGKTFGDAPFTVFATGGASGNPVTFSASGPASVSGNEVTITGAGSVTITASQAGNTNYSAATSVDQTFSIAKASQSISFTLRPKASTTSTIILAATGGAGSSPTTYSIVDGPGQIAGNSLTFTGPGVVSVRASRLGDSNYLDAASVDATVTVRANSAPVAVNDGIANTTGTSTLYPLANDSDADGDSLSILAVSEPSVVIDGRTLVVPAAYTGTFTYTVSDSFDEATANVAVTTGTPVTPARRFTGLLYNSTGKIVGRAAMSRTATGINVLNARVGVTTGSSVFGGTSVTASPTGLGPINVTLGLDNRVTLVLPSGVTGDLRPSLNTATAATYHVGLSSLDSAVPGAGVGRMMVTSLGVARLAIKMPDGRGFLATSDVSDNGSINFFGQQNITAPPSWIGGEFILSDLTKTDLTGEIEWVKPVQTRGLHRAGLNTVLVANGCKATGAFGIPDGPAVVTISGGNFASPVVVNSTVLHGKVTAALPTLTGWSAQFSVQSFRAGVKRPGPGRPILATGYFFPKSQTALGFFPGVTVGGKIELSIP